MDTNLEIIPRKIHYCWFGNSPLPNFVVKCLDSWKKNAPEFELIRWDESNCDINQNLYVEEAYRYKKWAFVSDYFRLKIIYENGGIYLDTDVELIKSPKSLLNYHCFFACDEGGINTGLGFGARRGHEALLPMLNYYEEKTFIVDGMMDLTPCTYINSKQFFENGYILSKDIVKIGEVHILPPEYCSIQGIESELRVTENTYGIHLSSRTWASNSVRFKAFMRLILGKRLVSRLKRFLR